MIRTQVQLTSDQARLLKETAAARGVSMAEVLRQLVEDHLAASASADRRQRALQVVGRHRSGRGTVSRDHDEELTDAFAR